MVRVFDSDNNAKAAWRALETVVRQRGEEPATFQQGIIATGGREDVTRRGHRSNDTTYRDSNSHYRQTCCATFYDFFVSSLRAWPSVDEVPHVVLDRWSENFGGKLRVSGGSCSILIEIRGWWMDRAKFHGILISRFENEVICSILVLVGIEWFESDVILVSQDPWTRDFKYFWYNVER